MTTFKCQECGKKFKTVKAAERASYNGCPRCGSCDIDLDTDATLPREPVGQAATRANENCGQ
jgi:Zn finger protein HypA/HybF involved in hydrogenase expression